MKTDIETLKNSFQVGYEVFEQSRTEAAEVWNMFHNRQYTANQINILENRGQPKETFNVIKLFARMLLGYYSTVVNTVNISPVQTNDIDTAAILSDLTEYTFRDNNFDTEGDKIKLDGLITGLMCSNVDVVDTELKDEFGRPIRKVKVSYVPASEVVLDPMSRLEDYSDARFIHRFKWMSEDQVYKLFGEAAEDKLTSYYNHLNVEEAEFEYNYGQQFSGNYKVMENFLIVHSIITDDDGKVWSIYWSDEVELERKEITYKEVKSSYRVHKLHTSDRSEYYGIFREVTETQKAINQAIVKIQLMVNTQKAFVETGAVEDIDNFKDQFNRVNSVIEMTDINGYKIENLTREVLDQYTIIDKAFDRIQRILGINDSFLGMAFASDSGRKVKLQQNQTVMSLRYITSRIEQFYRLLGWDVVNLIKQYYTATQAIRIADDVVGERWIEINKPMMQWTGVMDETNQPVMEPVMEQVLNPEDNTPAKDEWGNLLIAPVPTADTDIAFSNIDIAINASSYNDEDEKNQLMMETVLAGPMGTMLSQVNPAGYFKAYSLSVKSMKTRYSPEISSIIEQTAMMLGGTPAEAAMQNGELSGQSGAGGNQPMSQDLKLPQNTNEG